MMLRVLCFAALLALGATMAVVKDFGDDDVTTDTATSTDSTTPAATTPTTPAPIVTTAAPPPSYYCKCESTSLWLDIVFLVDTSDAVANNGLANIIATIQSILYGVTNGAAKFQTRAAIVSYASQVSVDYKFGDISSYDDVDNINIQYRGTPGENITGALEAGKDILLSNPRKGTKQVIFLIAASYRGDVASDPAKVAEQFKLGGGVIITTEYIQEGESEIPLLANISTPGYAFSNKRPGEFTGPNIIQALCDVNCFCPTGLTAYAQGNTRGVPSGGCHEAVNVPAVFRAAKSSCSRKLAIVSSAHTDDKTNFLMAQYAPKTKYWIGYEFDGSNWKFEDNSTLTYTKWAKGEPNIAKGKCAYAQQTSGFKTEWFAANCQNVQTDFYDYVCESRPCDSTYYCF